MKNKKTKKQKIKSKLNSRQNYSYICIIFLFLKGGRNDYKYVRGMVRLLLIDCHRNESDIEESNVLFLTYKETCSTEVHTEQQNHYISSSPSN